MSSVQTPEPGQLVRVRSRQYLVESVEAPVNPGDSALVRLSCLEDDAQGNALEVLWQREVDARILGSSSWEQVAKRGFDQPELFSAYLHALRWNCVTSTNPKLFQAPYRAGIQVKAYQLEPLRKALLMPRVNLFIADDVGVGKTIEAGLILRELLLRQKVRRVLIACPASVVRQWRLEMEARFGLPFVILDREYVIACRQQRGYGINPWSTHSRFILSHSLLRDETYAGPLRDWLGNFAPSSLLILDEAHNVAPASGTRYAVDSRLTEVVRELAPMFEHRLFLSATPHNGHSNSFSALLEILDPQRFCRGVPVSPKLRDEVMVRRLKSDIREVDDDRDFPERRVIPVRIDGLPEDTPELILSRLLQSYRRLRERQAVRLSASRQAMAMLVIINLQKRLLSSIAAFARTLAVHREAILKARQRAEKSETASRPAALPPRELDGLQARLFESPGADDARADLDDQELASEESADLTQATLAAEEDSQAEHSEDFYQEALALLDEMQGIANKARYRPDPRVLRLVDWLKTGRFAAEEAATPSEPPLCPELGTRGAAWTNRRVLIFTEYTDTRKYLQEQLEQVLHSTDRGEQRIAVFEGGMSESERDAVAMAFNKSPELHPVRILIATDAAREGLNLQNHCADLFHFDIPWNPSRMEQRNGRIDRKLQKSPVVRCHYFLLPQRAEDRVLATLVRKTATIQRELGSLSPTIERKLNKLLLKGISYDEASLLERNIDRVEEGNVGSGSRQGSALVSEELESTRKRHRELQAQLGELRSMLRDASEWLTFKEAHFRQALSASLKLLGVEGLQPLPEARGHEAQSNSESLATGRAIQNRPSAQRWQIPDLELRFGSDPAWTQTLDSLRAPRKPDQKLWEWRRDNPVLPLIFQDSGEVDRADVHLHLEHRLAQRLLNRFLSHGFLNDKLTRATVCLTEFPEPRVLVLGRLSLYGPHAARLHDELVVVAAVWMPLELRGRKRLEVLGEGAKEESLRLLELSLADPRLQQAPESRHRELQNTAERDIQDLLPALEKRAEILKARAIRALNERGESEARAMDQILREQKTRIEKHDADLEPKVQTGQLSLFPPEEQKQLEADRRYWKKRIKDIKAELEAEPDRIRATYEVRASRIEPAGLVYLWPVTG